MNHISQTICVGAPCSQARFEQFNSVKTLPICASCLVKAPVAYAFDSLFIGDKPLMIDSQCYVCEETTSVAFCKLR